MVLVYHHVVPYHSEQLQYCVIHIESDNPKKFKLVLQEFLYKIPFIPWMNIFNLAKSKINRKF